MHAKATITQYCINCRQKPFTRYAAPHLHLSFPPRNSHSRVVCGGGGVSHLLALDLLVKRRENPPPPPPPHHPILWQAQGKREKKKGPGQNFDNERTNPPWIFGWSVPRLLIIHYKVYETYTFFYFLRSLIASFLSLLFSERLGRSRLKLRLRD